jgi:WD40 repeat protein
MLSETKLTLLHTLTDHTDSVTSVALSADGQTLVSGSVDKTIKVWGA